MSPEDQPGLIERFSGLVDLVTRLDVKIVAALESLEEMRTTVTGFESMSTRGETVLADLQQRIARMDQRLHSDLDEVMGTIKERIAGLDLDDIGGRLQKLETAVFNIERATVNLDRAFEGGLEMLPDFMQRRLKGEGRKLAPKPTDER